MSELPFTRCLRLKELGFPQLRKFQAMYYVNTEALICIDDLSALKRDGMTDWEDIFKHLVFKPRVDDLLEASSDFLHEIVKMSDGSYFAYSTIREDADFLDATGRTDQAIRARGSTIWEALAALYEAVKSKELRDNPPRTLSPETLERSENIQEGVEGRDTSELND